jgi:hypothetical protein
LIRSVSLSLGQTLHEVATMLIGIAGKAITTMLWRFVF